MAGSFSIAASNSPASLATWKSLPRSCIWLSFASFFSGEAHALWFVWQYHPL